MAFLTDPSERYQEGYLEALQEFQAEGRHLDLLLEEVAAHFGDFVQRLREQADPAKLKGFSGLLMATTTLVDLSCALD